jgi:hypothetical protein
VAGLTIQLIAALVLTAISGLLNPLPVSLGSLSTASELLELKDLIRKIQGSVFAKLTSTGMGWLVLPSKFNLQDLTARLLHMLFHQEL